MKQNNAAPVEANVNQIADALNGVGYEAEAQPSLGIVKVYDPSDSEAMYNRADEACDCSFNVAMTGAKVFQIVVDN